MEEEQREQPIIIPYKDNLPLVCVGLIDAGSNKKIVVDAHLDFASSKTIIPTFIANEMNLSFAGSDETVTGAGIIYIPYYEVSIEVFGRAYDNVHVGCLDLPERTPAKALLGRDILDNYRICLDGMRKEIRVC
ncbi:MAG: hypothetical protein M3239_06985 [Thermoproteota archaeon]|nr:hypothetical protein [Thermoproteota archaeon]